MTHSMVKEVLNPFLLAVIPSNRIAYIIFLQPVGSALSVPRPDEPVRPRLRHCGTCHRLGRCPPLAVMGAFTAAERIQGCGDPTNTQNVWTANFAEVDVNTITKKLLPYLWVIAVFGVVLSAFPLFLIFINFLSAVDGARTARRRSVSQPAQGAKRRCFRPWAGRERPGRTTNRRMHDMKVRIGIDVGGTFTDAVAINNDTYELIGTVKVPTTHTAKEGVAAGIVEVLHKGDGGKRHPPGGCYLHCPRYPHGYQRSAGRRRCKRGYRDNGGAACRARKADPTRRWAALSWRQASSCPAKTSMWDTGAAQDVAAAVKSAVQELMGQGATSIVAAEAFSVDDPANENAAVHVCAELGVPGTATNDISKLYGLKIRTRTAVVNASIMPKMLEAATMTERSIRGRASKAR